MIFQNVEVQLGSVIGLGYLIGQYLNDRTHTNNMETNGPSKVEENIKASIVKTLQKLG